MKLNVSCRNILSYTAPGRETTLCHSVLSVANQGLLTLIPNQRCSPKTGQTRREERGLVIPNERRATQYGPFWDATRRDGVICLQDCVTFRSCTASTHRSMRLVPKKNDLRRWFVISVNRPRYYLTSAELAIEIAAQQTDADEIEKC